VDVDDWTTDSRSAFRILLDVKQDLLKFTSLWLAYEHLDEGFVILNTGALLFSGTDTGGSSLIGPGYETLFSSIVPDDLSIWRIGARQRWNDKWTTFEYVANHSYDDAGDMLQWAIGVVYKYNPNVQFGLVYSRLNFDDDFGAVEDPSVIRFRTFISF
jgi:hypothetical protein